MPFFIQYTVTASSFIMWESVPGLSIWRRGCRRRCGPRDGFSVRLVFSFVVLYQQAFACCGFVYGALSRFSVEV
jgi:hypothetical protein